MERGFSINHSEPLDRTVDCGVQCVRTLKGLAHPIRLAILVALGQGDLSPSRFARSRGEPVSNVSYHFRLLADLGLIELARTRPVRGSVEHIYRRVEAPAELVALVGWISALGGTADPAVDDPQAVPADQPGQLELLADAKSGEMPSDRVDVSGRSAEGGCNDRPRQLLDIAIEDPLIGDAILPEPQ